MTNNENMNRGQTFPDAYPVPDDPVSFEAQLIDAFGKQFPDDIAVLSDALTELQIAAGLNIPKYKATEDDRVASGREGLNDELGYLNLGPLSPMGFSRVTLTMPVRYSQEAIQAMTEEERKLAASTSDGYLIVGQMPEMTRTMLDGIYGLTGASVCRDYSKEGLLAGSVIRIGVYMGQKIYLEEVHNTNHYSPTNPTFMVMLVGARLGEMHLVELNQKQSAEFQQISGLDPFQTRTMMSRGEITVGNYTAVAGVLQATRAILNEPDHGEQLD